MPYAVSLYRPNPADARERLKASWSAAPIPLPLVQIGAGALLAWPYLGLHVVLDPELFLFLFLPPLLFVDGWRMPKRELWRLRGPVLTLAVGLVLFTVIGAGYFIHWILPTIPLPVAFALAAVLSPTDAVAVSAITQGRLPKPLMHMLQGEALLNDASGLVTFKFALAAAITGVFSLTDASITFLLVALGGLTVGVALSWLLGRLRMWMIARGWDDPATHVMFMLLLPFAAYVLAERLGVSGILSAVAAGMMQSWLDLLPRQTSTRLLNRSVWSLLEFAYFNDSEEAQALARQMDQLERRLRLRALRAQRRELYSLQRNRRVGDDVVREVLAELDLSEAQLGKVV